MLQLEIYIERSHLFSWWCLLFFFFDLSRDFCCRFTWCYNTLPRVRGLSLQIHELDWWSCSDQQFKTVAVLVWGKCCLHKYAFPVWNLPMKLGNSNVIHISSIVDGVLDSEEHKLVFSLCPWSSKSSQLGVAIAVLLGAHQLLPQFNAGVPWPGSFQ